MTFELGNARSVFRSVVSLMLAGASWLVLPAPTYGIELGLINDFSDGTQGWQGADPTQVPTGGPAGDGDAYLKVDSSGASGPGSKLATFNDSADWVGDFAALGASAVEMDVMNFETTGSALSLRFVLFGPTSRNNRWTTTEPVMVPNDGQWHHISFPLDADSITRALGSGTYEQMMAGVVRAMVRHDAGTPSGQGTPIAGSMGIDNIQLIGPPVGNPSDFNNDGTVDVADVNLLLAEVRAGTNTPQFDRTGDGLVNQDDILLVVTGPDELNTYIGDANLDGAFDSGDLVTVFIPGQYEDNVPGNSTWETGDWNGDGDFGTGDLTFAFQQGGFELGPRAAQQGVAIPEPSAIGLLAVGIAAIAFRRTVR
jgi:hypothetical protein